MKKIILFLILLIPFNIKAVDTSAEAAILMDMDSHRILYAKNINSVNSTIDTIVATLNNTFLAFSIILHPHQIHLQTYSLSYLFFLHLFLLFLI